MVDSGNAFLTCMSIRSSKTLRKKKTDKSEVYHRLKSTPRQSNSEGHRPSTSIAISTSAFPALTRFFGTLLVAAHIPFVQAGGISEELSNNIIADLAPFIALFGEQVTKQFMS